MVSSLIFSSLIYFEFIIVYSMRIYSNFILLHIPVQFSQHQLLKDCLFPTVYSCLLCHKLIDHLSVWIFFWVLDLCVSFGAKNILFFLINFIYFLIGRKLLYNFVFVSALQQCKEVIIVCISLSSRALLLSSHPTLLGHHRVPSWAPCIIQQVVTSYLFYTYSVYMSMLLSQFIPHSPSPAVFTTKFINTFFQIPYICVNM